MLIVVLKLKLANFYIFQMNLSLGKMSSLKLDYTLLN